MQAPGRGYIRYVRYGVQLWFLLVISFLGYRFFQFVSHFEKGTPYVQRPPSVEGFLPIAGFMSFKYSLLTGIVEPAHPAALVLFVGIVAVSLVLKKGFCGWICPIGTLSQYFWMVGGKVRGRNFHMNNKLDIPLRSVKYIIMGLFLLLIGVAMTPNMMVLFFITDYYKIVDVKTMKFFTDMSRITLFVLIGIGFFSLIYKNFWCRYLCPYGALLGLVSLLSPLKIRRNGERCIHCHSCTEHCPELIDVESKESVSSPECFACMTCVSHCPQEGALELSLNIHNRKKTIKPIVYPIVLILIFYLFIGFGIMTNHWKSKLPYGEYKRLLSPFQHTRK
ncbi:putative electron transport protein YccM [bacterium BMS3Bbin06]|nr:putative electron transport protein YccM [bacterium BMS3Abin08]GBE33645.1 putative electron transport protein YccM [bacterium BMS3Bbin06]HDO35002.1 4Fe-4S binding protein [Nitrospirota bacterium]HDY71710.1 4Fe-4S binding protein [Nitrospirota bacterium]